MEAAGEQDSSSATKDRKKNPLLFLVSSSVPLVSSRDGGWTTARSPSLRERGACSESPWLGADEKRAEKRSRTGEADR